MKATLLILFVGPLFISAQKEVFFTWQTVQPNDRILATYPRQLGPFEKPTTLNFEFVESRTKFTSFTLTGDWGYLNQTGVRQLTIKYF